MASETIISATFGSPGAGKTYSRVKWLVDDFLVNNPSGMYITNIPLNIPVISEYLSRILSKGDIVVSPDDIASRLHIIPDDVLIYWEKLNQVDNKDLLSFDSTTFPPAAYLQQFNLEGAHIAIDEFHKYFSKRGPKQLKKLWNDWFAEIRKTGCVFEGITQSYGQMADEFLDKCAIRLELLNHADLKDPFFYVRMGDWYELKAGLTGKSSLQRVSARETIRSSTDSGRIAWHPTGRNQTFVLSSDYFRFYNSFRNLTGVSGKRQTPSEIYGRKVIFWFLRRNIFNIVPRVLLVVLVAWFLLGGGFLWCFQLLFKSFSFAATKNHSKVVKTVPKTEKKHVLLVGEKSSVEVKNTDSNEKKLPVKKESGRADISSMSEDELKRYKLVQGELQSALSLYKPALFFNDYCVLRNSIEVVEGYKFNGGPYDGKTIKLINPKKRYYLLSDDTLVSMF